MTVDYSTADDSATDANNDYEPNSNTLTFMPGQTSKTITVLVNGDLAVEPSETFFVNLSNATNATIADAQGVGTITNDDGLPAGPSFLINDVTVTEDNSGFVSAVFTVTLSQPSTQTTKVNFATADGTTIADADYRRQSGTLTFSPGQTSKTVTVKVIGDLKDEPNQTFFVNLSNPINATITDAQGQGTILDNDATPTLSINDKSSTEGNSANVTLTFTVTLSAASGQPVNVDFATANNSAAAGADYTATSGTLTFNPGQTTKTFTVTVLGDTLDEIHETFFVNLTNPLNATLADAQGIGTITDNDATPSISINNVQVVEGNLATFTITLSAASGQTVTVNFATANGTALAGSDYAQTNGSLTFNPGETTKTVSVQVHTDPLTESNKTFFLNLSNAVNALFADSQGLGTILNA